MWRTEEVRKFKRVLLLLVRLRLLLLLLLLLVTITMMVSRGSVDTAQLVSRSRHVVQQKAGWGAHYAMHNFGQTAAFQISNRLQNP